jgi:cell division protein FtsZ
VQELAQYVDSLITIPNEKLLSVLGKEISLLNAFKSANDVLQGAVQGIAELITRPGLINVDFADVRTVMSEMGVAMMGSGSASGEDRARLAAEQAIHSPLLEDINLSGARGILVNITAGIDLSIGEFDEVGSTVKEVACDEATVVVGTVIDPDMRDELRVTVVATGLGETTLRVVKPTAVMEEAPVAKAVNSDMDESQAPDYSEMDPPTVIRKNPKAAKAFVEAAKEQDMDYLDIPAFLRRQAD